MLCVLCVGTVPMLCILYVGTVPSLCILNVGTVPTFSPSKEGSSMTFTVCLFDVVHLNGLLFYEWIDHVVKELNVKEALKLSIFVVQKAAAPKTGVEFCQGSNGTIRSSLATSYDVSRRRARSPNFDQSEARKLSLTDRHTHRHTENRHTGRPCSTSSAFKNLTC